MADVRKLLQKMAEQESQFRETTFLSPCVRGGQVRAKVAGIVQTFAPKPRDFEGWGIFRAVGEKTAEVVEEADLPLIAEYLKPLLPLRVRLAHGLQHQTWLAYPINESDARQRTGTARPLVVHLVTESRALDQIVARGDGASWWYEDQDRRADPQAADRLRDALKQITPPEAMQFKGLTPEMRTVYDLAAQQAKGFATMMQRRREESRLRRALETGGGELRDFHDQGQFWQVEWTTRDGRTHRSAIGKQDLTVISSGICLSGEDRKFDLQSLVGVMERRTWDDWDE